VATVGLKLKLAPPLWRWLSGSWRVNGTGRLPDDPQGPVIFACLHRDVLPAIVHCAPARPALLVSKSSDGEILRRSLAAAGFRFVRGSTGHDGREAYVGLLRELRLGHHVGLAVDGPRGPFGHVHPGAVQLARRAGVPIVPLTVRGRFCVQLRTWDRTVVPLPGAAVTVTPHEPVLVPEDSDADSVAAHAGRLAALLIGEDGGP